MVYARAVEIDPGASFFTAKNPEFGATFTYYLKDGLTTKKAERMKSERAISADQIFHSLVGMHWKMKCEKISHTFALA